MRWLVFGYVFSVVLIGGGLSIAAWSAYHYVTAKPAASSPPHIASAVWYSANTHYLPDADYTDEQVAKDLPRFFQLPDMQPNDAFMILNGRDRAFQRPDAKVFVWIDSQGQAWNFYRDRSIYNATSIPGIEREKREKRP
jgi:hypothetical protein